MLNDALCSRCPAPACSSFAPLETLWFCTAYADKRTGDDSMAQGSNVLLGGVRGKIGSYVVYPINGKTVIRTRGAFVKNDNDRQIQYQCGVRDVAAAWRQTPVKTQAMWGRLAARMPRWDAQTAQTPLTGYQAFQSVAWGLRALEKGIPAVPLLVPDLPQPLPDVTLSATLTDNTLRLTVGGGPFPDACQIFACKPAVPGAKCTNTWSQIAVVTDWDGEYMEIGESYAALFGVPQDGSALWLKLVPISQNGFRGQPLVRSVEVVEETNPLPRGDGVPPDGGMQNKHGAQLPSGTPRPGDRGVLSLSSEPGTEPGGGRGSPCSGP